MTDTHDLHPQADDGQTLVDPLKVAYGGHGPARKMKSEVEPGKAALTTSAVPEMTAIRSDALPRRPDVSSAEDRRIAAGVVRRA